MFFNGYRQEDGRRVVVRLESDTEGRPYRFDVRLYGDAGLDERVYAMTVPELRETLRTFATPALCRLQAG